MRRLGLPLFTYEVCGPDDKTFLLEDGWSEANAERFIKHGIRSIAFCGSSYDNHGLLDDNPDIPVMLSMPFHDALHNYENVAASVPKEDDNVFIRQFLNPLKYTVILIVELDNPNKLVGFAAFNHDEYVDGGRYMFSLAFQCLYVFPEYRFKGIGKVISRELARHIDEVRGDHIDVGKYKINKGVVTVNVECTSPAARACFEAFSDNLERMFSLDDFEDNIDIEFNFDDEY